MMCSVRADSELSDELVAEVAGRAGPAHAAAFGRVAGARTGAGAR
jgi:hypothetical protein